jgi:UDP-galactopyranose mutase
MSTEYIVAGAGLTGCTIARMLAEAGHKVTVHEKADEPGGNCADVRENGYFIHKHGPHAFHTNSEDAWNFLGLYCTWVPYEHKVVAQVETRGIDGVLPLPVNLNTIKRGYRTAGAGKEAATDAIAAATRDQYTVRELMCDPNPKLKALGRWVWETFYVGYSEKQWGCRAESLPESVLARVPVRFTVDDRYSLDRHQAVPAAGYTGLTMTMLMHPNIDYRPHSEITGPTKNLIYTGSVDRLFEYQYGRLGYRYLKFETERPGAGPVQPCAQVNFPSQLVDYTRSVEWSHFYGRAKDGNATCITREFPCASGDIPYYPFGDAESVKRHEQYKKLAHKEGVILAGRLGTYKYLNMDNAVDEAMTLARGLLRHE